MDRQTLLQLAADELEERALGYRQIEVLDYVPTQPERALLCPVGSVTVFVAAQGASILQRVRDVVITRSQGADAELAENHIRPRLVGRRRISYYQAWRQLNRSPVFASIRYGGRTLATNVLLPEDLGFAILENPYNGGYLSPTHLTLVEHRRDDTDFALDAVALKHSPPLSPAERAAVEQVPEDQLEGNLTTAGSCCDSVTEIVWLVTAITVAVMCTAAMGPEERRHLSEDQIQRLGPVASARELLEIRREALGHEH